MYKEYLGLLKSLKKIFGNPAYINWKLKTDTHRKLRGIIWSIFPKAFLSKSNKGNIVLFHIGRSGSTLLGDMLNQNPHIYWDGEVYNNILKSCQKLAINPFNYLNSKMNYSGKNKFYGFEVKFFHIKEFKIKLIDFIEELEKLDFDYFIILERKNYLRKILSSVKAHATSEWHQPITAKPRKSKITIKTNNLHIDNRNDTLINFIEEYDKDFKTISDILYRKRHLWLTYEDDIQDNPFTAYDKIVKFLNVDNYKVKVRYGKTNPFPLNEILANYDDIESILKHTRYKWMLKDKRQS